MFFLAPIKTEWCMKCYYDNKIFTFTWLAFIHFYLFPQNNFIFLECAQFLIILLHSSSRGGLATIGEERYKEGQMLFPTTICSEAAGGSGSYLYSAAATASHGSSTSEEVQLPWGSVHQHHKALQQKAASSPRSSSITSTTSLGSNMLEFSNNSSSSPREVGMPICFFIFLEDEDGTKLIYLCAYAS